MATTPKKSRTSTKKRKVKVKVNTKAKVQRKGENKGKIDTLQKAPTKVPSNSAVIRVKVKKK